MFYIKSFTFTHENIVEDIKDIKFSSFYKNKKKKKKGKDVCLFAA